MNADKVCAVADAETRAADLAGAFDELALTPEVVTPRDAGRAASGRYALLRVVAGAHPGACGRRGPRAW